MADGTDLYATGQIRRHGRFASTKEKRARFLLAVPRARIGAVSEECRIEVGKVRVKCSDQFRTSRLRLDSRKPHEAKTARTQRTPLFMRFSCRFHERTRKSKNGHPARRILVWASPPILRSGFPFRVARYRPLRQPGWLPLQPQGDANHV